MQGEVKHLNKELKHDEWMIEHVKDENRELRMLEKDLEHQQKKIREEEQAMLESWGDDGKNEKHNNVHMAPLPKHHGPMPAHHPNTGNIFKDLHALIMGKI